MNQAMACVVVDCKNKRGSRFMCPRLVISDPVTRRKILGLLVAEHELVNDWH